MRGGSLFRSPSTPAARVPRMRWTQLFAARLAVALLAVAISVDVVSADD